MLMTQQQWSRQEIMDTLICLRYYPSYFSINPLYVACMKRCIFLTLSFYFLLMNIQIVEYAEKFENKAILLIHFSARHKVDVSFWPSSLIIPVLLITSLSTSPCIISRR